MKTELHGINHDNIRVRAVGVVSIEAVVYCAKQAIRFLVSYSSTFTSFHYLAYHNGENMKGRIASMKPVISHSWDISEQAAKNLQQEMANQIVLEDQFDKVELVAGVDVAYSKENDLLIAGVVVMEAASLKIVEQVTAIDTARFPYISGLFSFRELPPLIKAFSKLRSTPDLVVCDGQGYAHPRRFGLACHLGLAFDVPSIGCGKTNLIGDIGELEETRGSKASILDNDEEIGIALRTQSGVKPVYVSCGHRVSLSTACQWILKLAPNYRLPETTREADSLVREVIKRDGDSNSE